MVKFIYIKKGNSKLDQWEDYCQMIDIPENEVSKFANENIFENKTYSEYRNFDEFYKIKNKSFLSINTRVKFNIKDINQEIKKESNIIATHILREINVIFGNVLIMIVDNQNNNLLDLNLKTFYQYLLIDPIKERIPSVRIKSDGSVQESYIYLKKDKLDKLKCEFIFLNSHMDKKMLFLFDPDSEDDINQKVSRLFNNTIRGNVKVLVSNFHGKYLYIDEEMVKKVYNIKLQKNIKFSSNDIKEKIKNTIKI